MEGQNVMNDDSKRKKDTMSEEKYVYFVLTEEGMESMASTAYDALTHYLAAGSGTDREYEWLSNVIEGKSEIVSIERMTRDEYKEWLKTAVQV
jgi:hypothetical protein